MPGLTLQLALWKHPSSKASTKSEHSQYVAPICHYCYVIVAFLVFIDEGGNIFPLITMLRNNRVNFIFASINQ